MGNSTLPTVSDKLNVMASIHNRKIIAALAKELKQKDNEIEELRQQISSLEYGRLGLDSLTLLPLLPTQINIIFPNPRLDIHGYNQNCHSAM